MEVVKLSKWVMFDAIQNKSNDIFFKKTLVVQM